MFDDTTQTNQAQNDAQTDDQAVSQLIGIGVNPSSTGAAPTTDTTTPVADDKPAETEAPKAEEPELVTPEPAAPAAPATVPSNLDDIKIQALQELSPLVDKLDQTPEEKYKTLMMMIQASDNQDLIPSAYTAAHGISDEKLKAEALLNIVNEINYFSQKSQSN